ncbi:MAG: hypothetical protein WBP28_02405 [Nostocoides sp.]
MAMKVIGSVVVPADLVGSRVALVRGIQRGNCEKGCRFAGDCTLLGAVLAGVARPLPQLLDDGCRIHCLARVTPPTVPAGAGDDGGGLGGLELDWDGRG